MTGNPFLCLRKNILTGGGNLNTKKRRIAEKAIIKIAERDGVTTEYVRKQIQLAMINGLCSTDPKIKAFWDSIPREKDIPTPEELIIHVSGMIKGKG
jgi:hypothetical protein